MRRHSSTFFLICIILASCGRLSVPGNNLTAKNIPTSKPSTSLTPEISQPPQLSPTPPTPLSLRIWLPPQFDPSINTPGGLLLKARLNEFNLTRSDVRFEVRIKAVSGPGGLLDSLSTANTVAPRVLPDLVALPRELLETAALKGLLYPLDNLTDVTEGPDWFEYSRQLARLQNRVYGLPFAGDALVLVFRPEVVPQPPRDWSNAGEAYAPLVFPASDPQALFTLALYQAMGGPVSDEQGRPTLQADILARVFTFYSEAEQRGLMPYWLTQYQEDDQVWEAFLEKRSDMTVTWLSHYLGQALTDANIAPIPTSDGQPFTLSTGWVWALATRQPERQQISIQLAEFLTDSLFLSNWAEASGFLPPRPGSLTHWSNLTIQPILNQVSESACLYPSIDILTSLGSPLEQAVVQILKKQSDPLTAAQSAVEYLTRP
jgi:multiple sugar transport system substrate-binding protein